MSFDFGKFTEQAQDMLERMKKAQDALTELTVTGEAGAGLVKITMNGRHNAVKVNIDPEVLKENKTVVEDLIAAAINDTVSRVEKSSKEKLAGLTGDMMDPNDLTDLLGGDK